MNRAISFAMVVVFCVLAGSAQAAGPKFKGVRKPVGVTKAQGSGFNFGNVTNPIVNTPPKANPHPISGAPAFPTFPPRFPYGGGHGPVVFNPPTHGPINGLPVPYKPQPTRGWQNWHHCNEWSWCMPMCYGDCWSCFYDADCYDFCGDFCWDLN